MKKVLIITHKIGVNYGGIMQAYALSRYLTEKLKLRTTVTEFHNDICHKDKVLRLVKNRIKWFLSMFVANIRFFPVNFDSYISKSNRSFISKYINQKSGYELVKSKKLDQFDFYIVGSDQVWRKAYVPVKKYMFDFLKDDSKPRISYAASFGKDDMNEYSPALIKKTAKLAKKFKSISVREKSGIKLAKDNWGVEADYHVDPTLLFGQDHYNKLIDSDTKNLKDNKGDVFAYVLDRAGEKGRIIDKVCCILGDSSVFEILPPKPKSFKEYKKDPEKYNLPPVTQWLKGFRDAKFVVTDSFHGCVFSIIYNKPFIAIGNRARGLARFTSLLEIFGLQSRLVSTSNEVTKELVSRWALRLVKSNNKTRVNG